MHILRNIVILLLSLSLLSGFSTEIFSQNDKPELEYKPLEKSLLWEITGKGLKRPSYLYGTIHLIPRDSF